MDFPPSKVVAVAVEAARAAAVAASEARCAVFVAEKEAKAAVQFAAIVVDKVEAVKASSNVVWILNFFVDRNGLSSGCCTGSCRLQVSCEHKEFVEI
jgi:hypothetical protein